MVRRLAGTYKAAAGSDACNNCGQGKFSATEGATSNSTCLCPNLEWSEKSIEGTSEYPCDLNSMTVTLAPTLDVYQSCVEYLEFTGFGTGTMTASTTREAQGMALTEAPGEFEQYADWDSGGTLTVWLTSGAKLDSGATYAFTFQVRNGQESQTLQSVSINAPLVSGNNKVSMDNTILRILAASWTVDISSSSSNPCEDSTISIVITPAVAPIKMFCDPGFVCACVCDCACACPLPAVI